MRTAPPPQYACLMAHILRSVVPSVTFEALWLPVDGLWYVGAKFRTPEQMAEMGWSYDSPWPGPDAKKPAA